MRTRTKLIALAVAFTAVAPAIARADGQGPDAEIAEARATLRAAIGSMEGTAAHMRATLREARKTRDTAKIACVDEALSRADVSLRQAKAHAAAAEGALSARDLPEARREMKLVSVLRDAVRDAGSMGDACAVRPAWDLPAQRDTTVVRVYVDPRLPRPEP